MTTHDPETDAAVSALNAYFAEINRHKSAAVLREESIIGTYSTALALLIDSGEIRKSALWMAHQTAFNVLGCVQVRPVITGLSPCWQFEPYDDYTRLLWPVSPWTVRCATVRECDAPDGFVSLCGVRNCISPQHAVPIPAQPMEPAALLRLTQIQTPMVCACRKTFDAPILIRSAQEAREQIRGWLTQVGPNAAGARALESLIVLSEQALLQEHASCGKTS
jgi:hypothetical protein